ncbi:hypothetical protein CBR_g32248 [Chara braunii]|uniref:Protein kinase domain-containing protein n=1 Tax=Chara braunii TaxID=69332 RepID=A0A388JN76_CHABU|nr:hypothetical protein CBR_g32248 [Chara braunii]|eukprot:GBG59231.1 hypothetical protein CBR_g32248 [Chara braunii]
MLLTDATDLINNVDITRKEPSSLTLGGVDVSSDGSSVFFSAAGNGSSRILRLSQDGEGNMNPPFLAGVDYIGYHEGSGTSAWFNDSQGIALSADGSVVYVADSGNQMVRAVDVSTGETSHFASTYSAPNGVAIDHDNKKMYVSSTSSILTVQLEEKAAKVLAGPPIGSDTTGWVDNNLYSEVRFHEPHVEPSALSGDGGVLYVADTLNHRIRRVHTNNGLTETIAGSTQGHQDGTPIAAQFDEPRGMALTSDGCNLFVCERHGQLLRRITFQSPGGPALAVDTVADLGGGAGEGMCQCGSLAISPNDDFILLGAEHSTLFKLHINTSSLYTCSTPSPPPPPPPPPPPSPPSSVPLQEESAPLQPAVSSGGPPEEEPLSQQASLSSPRDADISDEALSSSASASVPWAPSAWISDSADGSDSARESVPTSSSAHSLSMSAQSRPTGKGSTSGSKIQSMSLSSSSLVSADSESRTTSSSTPSEGYYDSSLHSSLLRAGAQQLGENSAATSLPAGEGGGGSSKRSRVGVLAAAILGSAVGAVALTLIVTWLISTRRRHQDADLEKKGGLGMGLGLGFAFNLGSGGVKNGNSLRCSTSVSSGISGMMTSGLGDHGGENRDGLLGIHKMTNFSLETLAHATSNFSTKHLVPKKGGFGEVYRGVLEDKRVVAIKKMTGELTDAKYRQFLAEVQVQSKLHHAHLCELMGYCAEKDKLLLIYPFIHGGSLHDCLHGCDEQVKKEESCSCSSTTNMSQSKRLSSLPSLSKSSSSKQPAAQLNLDWQTRVTVAMHIAMVLRYLHEEANPPVVHRDVKSSNILLETIAGTTRVWAWLTDFGLAKLGGNALLDVQGNALQTCHLSGTYGYMPPEYLVDGKLTEKNDVYAFGVVLLELITGKKAVIRDNGSQTITLVAWATPLLEVLSTSSLMEITDPELNITAMQLRTVYALANVAAKCVQPWPDARPAMSEVVERISRINATFSTLQHSVD